MDLVGTLLPLALVVGLSPLPITPAVLILMTPRARANSAAFLGAWVGALTGVTAVALLLAGSRDPGEPTEAGIGWIQVLTGTVFLVMAAAKWLRRPAPGAAKEPPRWMAALGSYGPGQSARLGAALAAANPKNLLMALAGGAEIAALADGAAATVAATVGFVAVGSIGVGTPILTHRILGERAAPVLARWKTWLEGNSTALAVGVLLVLGGALLVKGLAGAL
ncbi:MAG: GAP family protein [Candidatus Nanopelagicales bacterium]